MLELQEIVLCIIAGLLAGIINTLAGSGSIITLSLLTFLGLPTNIANGTNRIGLFFQSAGSTFKFYQQRELMLSHRLGLLTLSVIGAIFGVIVASRLPDDHFQSILGGVFCVLFLIVLFEPHKHLKHIEKFSKLMPLIMAGIGFYAGFIQVGAGVFMLAVMHVVWGKSYTSLNPLKVFIILLINIIALVGYGLVNQIHWEFGLLLAIGQLIGGFVGVRLNNLKGKIEPFIKMLILGIILISILRFWHLI